MELCEYTPSHKEAKFFFIVSVTVAKTVLDMINEAILVECV